MTTLNVHTEPRIESSVSLATFLRGLSRKVQASMGDGGFLPACQRKLRTNAYNHQKGSRCITIVNHLKTEHRQCLESTRRSKKVLHFCCFESKWRLREVFPHRNEHFTCNLTVHVSAVYFILSTRNALLSIVFCFHRWQYLLTHLVQPSISPCDRTNGNQLVMFQSVEMHTNDS